MTSRDKIVVQQLKLTPKQLRDAMERASETVKKMVKWEDPVTRAAEKEK